MIAEHRRLVELLSESGGLAQQWRSAFEAVPRHLFVPDAALFGNDHEPFDRRVDAAGWMAKVYSDDFIVTQLDDGAGPDGGPDGDATSSTSMPTMVARMLDVLDVDDGMRVLEIGTGTGWNAALLAARLGDDRVVTVEIDPTVAERARRNLAAAGWSPVVVVGDGEEGYEPGAPYDRILATCAMRSVPHAWIGQTRPGGVVVTPWGTDYMNGWLLRLHVDGDGTASGRFVDTSAFMWSRPQRPERRSLSDRVDIKNDHATESATALWPSAVVDFPHAALAVGAQVSDCRWLYITEDEDDEPWVGVWFYTGRRGSWAHLILDGDSHTCRVRQFGPRRLWDEVEAAYGWWAQAGEPEYTRFGVTVSAEGQRVWLDNPDQPLPSDGR